MTPPGLALVVPCHNEAARLDVADGETAGQVRQDRAERVAGAGAHGGPSGRYAELDYEAEIYAWALAALGSA